MTTLTVAVCTRDRESDLKRCLESVLAAPHLPSFDRCEVLIVDDGALPNELVNFLKTQAANMGWAFRCLKNSGLSGLYNARLMAVKESRGDVILFFDDDVTIAPDYLANLSIAYRQNPYVAGVGGIDQLAKPRRRLLSFVHRVFLLDSGRPGKLSFTGFSGSMLRWIEQQTDFRTEYLSGCNMSFKIEVLRALVEIEWLRGYSLGEDLYLSYVASRHGPLLVSPSLRVWHHRSVVARERSGQVAEATIVNAFRMLRLRHSAPVRAVALLWTAAWFVLKDAVRPAGMQVVLGYLRGIGVIVRILFSSHTNDSKSRAGGCL